MCLKKYLFLLRCPGFFIDIWVQVIVPSLLDMLIPLSNLFGSSIIFRDDFLHFISNQSPFFFAMLVDKINDNLILLIELLLTYGVHNLRSMIYLCLLRINFNFVNIIQKQSVSISKEFRRFFFMILIFTYSQSHPSRSQ